MEIRNLISFMHVAELNSFTKAAAKLGYSQSTISFQIKQLETELNCLLFERINHTISLTEKGKELMVYAQQINNLTKEFNQSLCDDSELSGHIHIVTPDSICETMMTAHYTQFYKRYPKITIKFSNGDTNEMFRLLDSNQADVMLTLDDHTYHPSYTIAKEERVPAHFVTVASSPFCGKKNMSFKDIINEPFILTEKGVGYRRVFDDNLAKMSIYIEPVLEIGRTDIITSVLEQGMGISFLPDFVTRKKVQEGKLCYLDIIDFPHDVWKQLIHHKNKWISRPLRAFLDYVIEKEFD
ncbi:MAG: LysR family transcriptional regulator [Clostridia bacterium]|nr:LysR family transcriptional regulator [Clostridia bacterium]